MKSSRLLSALVVPAVTLALMSCSSADETPTESHSKPLATAEASEGPSSNVEPSESQEQTPEEVSRVFNEFYAKLSDEERNTELNRLQDGYWEEIREMDENAPLREMTATDWEFMYGATEDIYGDLLDYFDMSGMNDEEVSFLLMSLSSSNAMYSAFGADSVPEVNLRPEDVTVDGNSATLSLIDVFDFSGTIHEDAIPFEDSTVTMVYKDGKWLFTPDLWS